MAVKFWLCLVVLYIATDYSECKWFSGLRRSFKLPKISFNPINLGKQVHSYSSSLSGLSGYGINKHSYPSSLSGLSGYGINKHSYPSSLSGLSGYGIETHSYPSSLSGLSGHGGLSSSYGISGYGGSGYKYDVPSYGLSRTKTNGLSELPRKNGLSSSLSASEHERTVNTSYTHYSRHDYQYINYSAPQYVYITEYRNSNSRYGELLAGLALLNMDRSNNKHHEYYYKDDYYRGRYKTADPTAYKPPKDNATCNLRIKNDNKVEVLKIPCEIVSTFTEGSKKVPFIQTTCVSNYTMFNKTRTSVTLKDNSMITLAKFPNRFNQTTPTASVSNATNCTIQNDPLAVKGPSVNTYKMECEVDIITKDSYILRSKIDCSALQQYGKKRSISSSNSYQLSTGITGFRLLYLVVLLIVR